MKKLENEYQDFLKNNPESTLTYDEWFNKKQLPVVSDDFKIGPHGAFEYDEMSLWDCTLLDGLYELCDCNKMAVWCYMPGYSSKKNPYFCDDCVPRGCSCNHTYIDKNNYSPPLDSDSNPPEDESIWKWIKEGEAWTYIDEIGREYPCVEYYYDNEGFEIE